MSKVIDPRIANDEFMCTYGEHEWSYLFEDVSGGGHVIHVGGTWARSLIGMDTWQTIPDDKVPDPILTAFTAAVLTDE